ncbi:MAG: NAD-dependent epimerase/dehydratase family protein, partial [Acidimicrobiales bacterium]
LDLDVRNRAGLMDCFAGLGSAVSLVVHAAAQPSHDWAATDPFTDFEVNALGTLNVLEATRRHAPEAAFCFLSTNKVYGDAPNELPLVEKETRWEIEDGHRFAGGISEDMRVDRVMHSLFGVSKLAADAAVQEYGRYFGLRTACFRGGTLTGPRHAAARLHGFLAYVMRCTMTGTPYEVLGYGGKQVRDAIHCRDVVAALEAFFRSPRVGEVYNLGGGRTSNASVLEAIALAQEICGRELTWTYRDGARAGDHIWWIGDNGRFQSHYPHWRVRHDVPAILREIHDSNQEQWRR